MDIAPGFYMLVAVCILGLLLALVRHRAERKNFWLHMALASMGDAIVITDARGRLTEFNAAAEQLSGWLGKEALGKPVSDVFCLVDHDTRTPLPSPVIRALESKRIIKVEDNTVLIARDSTERPVYNSTVPVQNSRGRVIGTVSLFRDITKRYMTEQKLLESEERLKAVTDEVRIGLVMINRDRRYVYANNFYMQMVGISNTVNVMGKRVVDILPVLYEQIRPNLDRAFAGERLSYEIKGIANKELGLNRIYSVTYEPQKRQSLIMHVIIVVLDITDIKNSVEG